MFIPVLSSSWPVNELLHEWLSVMVNFFVITLEFRRVLFRSIGDNFVLVGFKEKEWDDVFKK